MTLVSAARRFACQRPLQFAAAALVLAAFGPAQPLSAEDQGARAVTAAQAAAPLPPPRPRQLAPPAAGPIPAPPRRRGRHLPPPPEPDGSATEAAPDASPGQVLELSDLPARAPLPPPRPVFAGEEAPPAAAPALPQTTLPPDAQPTAPSEPDVPSWWPFGRQTPPAPAAPPTAQREPESGRRGRIGLRPRIPPTDAEVDACVGRLRAKGAEVERIAPVVEGSCGLPVGVRLSRLPGNLPLSVPAIMTCALAEGVDEWVETVVRPAAQSRFGSRPTKLLVGPTYQCRTMNHQPGAKLSEHAFGNAMDVAGMEFDRHTAFHVGFLPSGSAEGAFLTEIRGKACVVFDTVLGPGSDPYHSTHLHLDLRNRGSGKHICR